MKGGINPKTSPSRSMQASSAATKAVGKPSRRLLRAKVKRSSCMPSRQSEYSVPENAVGRLNDDWRIPKGKIVAVDTETTGLNHWKGDRPFCVSFCNEKGERGFIRWPVNPHTREVYPDPVTLKALQQFFNDTSIKKVFYNAKFDVRMLRAVGIKFPNLEHPDWMEEALFAIHVLRPLEPNFQLKTISDKYLGVDKSDQKALQKATTAARRVAKLNGWNIGEKVQQDYWLAPEEVCREYAEIDAERTMLLWLLLEEQLDEEGVRAIYTQEVKELWGITLAMEERGFHVFRDRVVAEIKKNEKNLKQSYKELVALVGHEVDYDSPQALGDLLFKELKLPVQGHTKTGKPTTGWDDLSKINHPVIPIVARCKSAKKALSTFFYPYMERMVEEEPGVWILHPDLDQVGAKTGRYSCRMPNLQNVANEKGTRSKYPIHVRGVFGPRPGYVWYHFDYSQIEMRLFADFANEQTLMDALIHGRDVHGESAARAWPEEYKQNKIDGTKNARNKAKMLNFGKIYGIGVAGTADLLMCTHAQAKAELATFDEAFPDILAYMKKMQKFIREEGRLFSAYGRMFMVDPGKDYRIVNYQVQGTAADVMKTALIKVHRFLSDIREKQGIDARLVLTVHDELVVEMKQEQCFKWVLHKIKRLMEDTGGRFNIALPVEIEKVTEEWGTKQKVTTTKKGVLKRAKGTSKQGKLVSRSLPARRGVA